MKCKCRGRETRIKLVEKYDIKPIAHVKLLSGQTKKSCTGDLLTDSYYCFSYQMKKKTSSKSISNYNDKSQSVLNSFYCGSHASQHFLELLKLEPLPCFNPLRNITTDENIRENSYRNTKKDKVAWNKTRRELYNALNLLMIHWDVPPKGPILEIMLKIEKQKYDEPHNGLIKSVNTIVSKNKKGNNMNEILSILRKKNNIKDYTFNRVNAKLAEMGINSYF